MKKILFELLIMFLILVGCNKKINTGEEELLTFDFSINSSALFLKNGTRIRDVLTIAEIIDSEDMKSSYNFNIFFMNGIEQKKIATLNLRCSDYNKEFNICVKGSEKLQINGKPIIIYEGEYYLLNDEKHRYNSFIKMTDKYVYFINSLGFYKTGSVGLYDLEGNKILGDGDAIEKYFTPGLELIDAIPKIIDNYFIYYTCDIKNEKIMKNEYNLTTNIGSITETIDGYCNTEQSFFSGSVNTKK